MIEISNTKEKTIKMKYEYYEDRSLICSFVQNIYDECVSQTVVRGVLNNERYKAITCV